jgi:hypothetical protein
VVRSESIDPKGMFHQRIEGNSFTES